MMIILSACGKKTTSTKTANTSSKTVSQVLEEKTNATNNTNDKNHGGNVTNPNDNSNKPSSSFNKIGEVGASSNLKKSKSTKNMQASDIDIDLTTLSSTMVYSEVYNMMNSPEKYVGKMVRMNGKFAVYKYPERNYYTCIIKDAKGHANFSNKNELCNYCKKQLNLKHSIK